MLLKEKMIFSDVVAKILNEKLYEATMKWGDVMYDAAIQVLNFQMVLMIFGKDSFWSLSR